MFVVKAPFSIKVIGGCLFNVAYVYSNLALCMDLDNFVNKIKYNLLSPVAVTE